MHYKTKPTKVKGDWNMLRYCHSGGHYLNDEILPKGKVNTNIYHKAANTYNV